MYNLDNVVKIYYSSVSIRMIFETEILYKNFPQREFARLAQAYITRYSDTENEQLYNYIQGSVGEEGHPFAGMRNRSGLNVFAALEELAEQLLLMENNEVVCLYGNLLRLRKVSEAVEEDLLVCAYLAARCKRTGTRHCDFAWDTTIGHNNVQLKKIMERGISENHFHLFGSAPSFHLMWVYFMNHVGNNGIYQFAKAVEKNQRMTREHYSIWYSEEPFVTRILKAALIRVYIVNCFLEAEESDQGADRDEAGYERFSFDIESVLLGQEDVAEYYSDIQRAIDCLREEALTFGMGKITDYALRMTEDGGEGEYCWAAGERQFMHNVLLDELTEEEERCLPEKCYQWFYAYLVIKQSVRCEIIQVNDVVGFENFSVYSKRKKAYTDTEQMIKAAVCGSLESGNIQSLEIRVSPRRNAADNARWLQSIDQVIQGGKNPVSRASYYYVFHFSKEKDILLERREDFDGYHCRHYKRRRSLEKEANGIYFFRENYRETALEVLGIDACSQEIGCRPEVFAPVFRFLSEHIVGDIPGVPKVGQLKMTYHVGEDFLDAVDGLRAVDEAIHHLNLQCGDRIGHGTVLGIDIKKWYTFKQYTIVLPRQDYLDNIVWLYHKLVEYHIEGFDNLREKLLQEFELYFTEVYLYRESESGSAHRISRYIYSRDRKEEIELDREVCNIHTYYEAWKLRGDAPELYMKGYFDSSELFSGREWTVNRKFPEAYRNRLRDEISYLYYLYHYDWDVRYYGQKSVQIYITPLYVEGVVAVQKAMQREFAAKGIGMEANPSSNLVISTMREYAEHPIVTLYNKDLTWETKALSECPQVNISINTDDKGVFHTSLENEYALMACAMEKVRDEKEVPVYNRQMIYQWIDNIREMGNLQSFRERNRERR